ncbi:MAG: hypothetical protein UT38_C0003G0025 [Microgenomates group bacterium GW2011_GWA2_39_19]|nr:MAG: hypothetical protein UT38_C0003G0025 [Microgenomates group bacterium GW2011_GWA2_39_19]OGY14607.1 MAG: hypothetical protein A3I52_00495 [Candidatus Blackburnbacteria bacterium RIFCSPLOWO2_02_FULL_40_10]HBL52194.1 hypothetical protein [Candidatus Blackburnbacteria bacterium]
MLKDLFKVKPIQATTQQHLLIADIVDDIILTKDGGAGLVLEATALNFSLLSEREQEAITYAYAAFLNSLSFPIQIMIRSQQKDVSNYLSFLRENEEKIQNPLLKELMQSYENFVAQIVKKRNVLEKQFFIIIPFLPFELGLSAANLLNSIVRKRKSIPYTKEYVVKKAKTALYPRRDHLIRQSGRLSIKLKQLNTEQLAQLFFAIYKEGERFEIKSTDYDLPTTENNSSAQQ